MDHFDGINLKRVRRIASPGQANEMLREIEMNSTMSHKYVVLECSALMAKQIIVDHVRDIYMSTRNYHFLITQIVMEDYFDGEGSPAMSSPVEFSALNITGFILERNIRTESKQYANFIKPFLQRGTSGGGGQSSTLNGKSGQASSAGPAWQDTILSVCSLCRITLGLSH